MSSLPEDLDRIVRADLQRGIDDLAASVQSATDGMQAEISYWMPVEPGDLDLDRPAPPSLTVRKMAMVVPVSDQLLHPENYPSPHVSRRNRFRWWRRNLIYNARTRLGELVAGRKFYDSGDYD